MLIEKNSAIVLKTYLPQKYKLCVLDNALGKVMGVPNREDVGAGAFIEYHAREQQNLYFMHGIEIIDLPMLLAKEDLLFVHHVLELCYFFVPVGSRIPRLFTLLTALYTSGALLQAIMTKKIFLFQLFACLGLYPEGVQFKTPYFHQLTIASIDNIAVQQIDLVIEQELDDWLLNCIALHPCTHNFKTVHFLQKNRII